MRKLLLVALSMFICADASWAYHVEVLQLSNIEAYEQTYQGFIDELARNDIIEGKNLIINRHIIDADAEASLWKKVGILLKIKKTASKIVDAKPDLVLTVSTPGTKYSKDKFINAGIPVVFTCVANPPLLGCPSVEQPLPGLTGATLYLDPLALLVLVKMAKPDIETIGIVHSDDDNAVAFADESKRKSPQLGLTILTKELEKSDKIKPAALELIQAGVEAFAIPLDQYYGLRDMEPATDIMALAAEHNIPIFSFANFDRKGALLYAGPELGYNGVLSGKQAVRILKEGEKPEDLPILKQNDLNIYVDTDKAKQLGIDLPEDLLKIAKKR